GWWHVWNRLQRAGLPVERDAVKLIYREDEMVLLRRSSPELAKGLANPVAIINAKKACGMTLNP
ncbi:MAG: hypothetical protein ACRCT6_09540, partial [Notoacmeibacter sp.]